MNAHTITTELELAAYELAEAEQHERTAQRLRNKAAKRIAALHANITTEIKAIEKRRNELSEPNRQMRSIA